MSLELLTPEATVNFCANPSVEVDTTGWAANSPAGGLATISRERTQARFGRASVKVVTSGLKPGEGVYYTGVPNMAGSPVTGSIYLRGRGQLRLAILDATNALTWYGDPFMLVPNYWVRASLSVVLGPLICTNLRLAVVTIYNQPTTFYADGLQLEAKPYVTTYCDGDRELLLPVHDGNPFFEWVGQRHLTASFRSKAYRGGGVFKDVSRGLDVGLYPTIASGLGMPPIEIGSQVFAGQERALLQSQKALPRSVGLTFHARRYNDRDECDPQSLAELRAARSALLEVLKPDRVGSIQPAVLRYRDGRVPMDLDVSYEAGMEWEGDMRDPTLSEFGLRLFAPDPFWRTDSQDVAVVSPSTVITPGHAYLAARLSGAWTGFGSASFPVRVLKVHPNGDVYAGGDFLNIGGVACRHIGRWDGTQWNILAGAGNDIDNGTVYAIDFAPNGDVYIGGTFTTVGGATYNRVARYTPSTDAFDTLVAGANPGVAAEVRAIACDRNGYVWIGGTFLATTSGVTAFRLIRYNGAVADTWTNPFPSNGVDAAVYALEMDLDGTTVFIGGAFTQENGKFDGVLGRCCYFNGTSFVGLGELHLNGTVYAMRFSLDGRLYVGGAFTIAGFWNAAKVAMWNRQEWYPLGSDGDGLSGGTKVNCIDIDKAGNIYFGGDFTAATNNSLCTYVALWSGTRFAHLDIVPGAEVVAIASKVDKLWLGYLGASVTSVAQVQTVTNYGAAGAYPVLDVLGPVTLRWLENQETGKVVRMNLAVLAGERVLVDLRPGFLKAVSEWRGNVMWGIAPDSDFGDFELLPGDNQIAFHGTGGNGSEEVSLEWQLADWSFDEAR